MTLVFRKGETIRDVSTGEPICDMAENAYAGDYIQSKMFVNWADGRKPPEPDDTIPADLWLAISHRLVELGLFHAA